MAQVSENANPPPNAEKQVAIIENKETSFLISLSNENEIAENENKANETLRIISEESAQLGKCLNDEKNLIGKLCTLLSNILKNLGVSFNIPPENLPLKRKTKKVILNQEGQLKLLHEDGKEEVAFLSQYPPEIIASVLWVTIPELVQVLTSYKKRVSKRISFFESVKNQLSNVFGTLASNPQENANPTAEKKESSQQVPNTPKTT